MDVEVYKLQLQQINTLLESKEEGPEKDELTGLKRNIEELLELAGENTQKGPEDIDDEYARFMKELSNCETENARNSSSSSSRNSSDNLREAETKVIALQNIEGKKYRAPHKHRWGETIYHNVMVSSVLSNLEDNGEIQVKVLFLNPTHQEMLPCPYFFDAEGDCKFSEDRCKFSHGEIVLHSHLQDYVEPNFESLMVGSYVLAKQTNNLWSPAKIRSIGTEKCLVQFQNNKKKVEQVLFEHIFPMDGDSDSDGSGSESEADMHVENDKEDVINLSLMTTPTTQRLGEWEKHTKGIGSKLMEKMGYVVGSGLGKKGLGRVEPVTAVILPPGKSLDHCMNLREKCGGDKNLFSAERKLKRMQRRQEMRNQKVYEREKNKVDVFSFINNTVNGKQSNQSESSSNQSYRQSIKKESERNLNVAGLVLEENIRKCGQSIEKYKIALTRHTDVNSVSHKELMKQLNMKHNELKTMQGQATTIKNEQNLRNNKKKISIF